MISHVDGKCTGALLVPDEMHRQSRPLGLICLHPMQCVCKFQILLDRGDFVVEPTMLFFEGVQSVLVGVDARFQADRNIGEFFKRQLSEESMLALYACFHDKSIEWRKNMACMQA